MFAVIKTGGKQYRVAANDVIKIEKIDGIAGDIIEFGEVLAHGEGDDATFGAPFVSGATVTAEVVLQGRGKTVIAFKKRRRQNSRRKRGNRQYETTVRIDEILIGGAKPSKKAAAAKDAAPAKPEAAVKPDAAAKAETAEKKSAASESKAAAKPAPSKAESSAKPAALFSAPAGEADDLVVIKGIGPVAAGQLKEQGITTFAQLAAFTDDDIARIDANMPFSADQIRDWQEQARDLAKKA